MKFKIDENLPSEVAERLREAGYDAATAVEQQLGGASDAELIAICQSEHRALVTLDAGFGDIRNYPPASLTGIVVLRLHRQDKPYVLQAVEQLVPILSVEPLEKRLWIVEEARVRIRE